MSSASDAGSLKRGVLLLKLLATAGPRGLALTEIATRTDLPHPSVHRVLQQLGAERLVDRNEELKRYRLGPLAFELGVAGSAMHDIRDLCDPAMDALAKATEDTVYLVVRSGFDAVCMHRREGSFPIRTLVLEVGSRRPLGVGAGGLAILASIAQQEREEIVRRVAPNLAAFASLTAQAVIDACQRTHEQGISLIRNKINLGVTAIGHAFRDPMGQSVGALSVAALSQRMTAARVRAISALLRDACADVERRARAQSRNGWTSG
ncbi:transcriptional regulator, IclR family [Variovorax sp. OK605]|jgi:DNA-binding IclR family transcriptional regulator|uniref:IclR family transcriptional regulator n=1 Tax=unclassified Variovorax TaxID=663243 RepID=UPI0008B6DBE4|nr:MULTISPECIES: IclR family transcriptional regulator [unclassified Variovorax]SEK12573.1 transcriptional regulator, IclR family [Variovorax sp. OK202]SFD82352.1 transcriptional regulator, IclR family [Variovorax sp. OK212]SFP60422.1 transcriptional regulator, IclR family [Variovorax sp. OK605]